MMLLIRVVLLRIHASIQYFLQDGQSGDLRAGGFDNPCANHSRIPGVLPFLKALDESVCNIISAIHRSNWWT
jgi:hypothetical protein